MAAPTWAEAKRIVKVQYPNLTYTLEIDDLDVVKIDGLPLEATHLYSIPQATMYVKHPDEDRIFMITPDMYEKGVQEIHAEKVGDWARPPNTRSSYWTLTRQGKTCAHIFGNTEEAKKASLNLTDLTRIHLALKYLYSGPGYHPCDTYKVSAATGKVVGLPLYSTTHRGEGSVSNVYMAERPSIKFEEKAVRLPLDAHVRFLTRSLKLSKPRYQAFKGAGSHTLPLKYQREALKRVLSPSMAGVVDSIITPQPGIPASASARPAN